MTTKILCGIDGQVHSTRAAAVAFELAKELRAELTMCMVNPLLPGRGGPLYLWPQEYLEGILTQAAWRARWAGVPEVKCESLRAISIADAIVAYADLHEIDYIVVGARDRSALLRLLSGSVSKDVIAKANCPVLVVKRVRGQQQGYHDRGVPERIVFLRTMPSAA